MQSSPPVIAGKAICMGPDNIIINHLNTILDMAAIHKEHAEYVYVVGGVQGGLPCMLERPNAR